MCNFDIFSLHRTLVSSGVGFHDQKELDEVLPHNVVTILENFICMRENECIYM